MKYETALQSCCILEPRLWGALQNAPASAVEIWLVWKFLQSCEPECMSSPELNKIKLQETEPTF